MHQEARFQGHPLLVVGMLVGCWVALWWGSGERPGRKREGSEARGGRASTGNIKSRKAKTGWSLFEPSASLRIMHTSSACRLGRTSPRPILRRALHARVHSCPYNVTQDQLPTHRPSHTSASLNPDRPARLLVSLTGVEVCQRCAGGGGGGGEQHSVLPPCLGVISSARGGLCCLPAICADRSLYSSVGVDQRSSSAGQPSGHFYMDQYVRAVSKGPFPQAVGPSSGRAAAGLQGLPTCRLEAVGME